MFFAFFILLLFNAAVGALVFFIVRRVLRHMAECPESARLIAEHVLAPILTGKTDKPEVKKNQGWIAGVGEPQTGNDPAVAQDTR